MSRRIIHKQSAFTLVELLVVIAIISILVGLLVPAVRYAYTTSVESAAKLEIEGLATAIETYRTNYGDYPPDGSSWTVVERHLRKRFPQIEAEERELLNPANRAAAFRSSWLVVPNNDSEPFGDAADLRVMEPAEALVFWLGGFSDDPHHPLTGEGGPFKWIDPSDATKGLQYNTTRKNALFDFKAGRLTLEQVNVSGVSYPISISNDESLLGLREVTVAQPSMPSAGPVNDLLPMYFSSLSETPIVYFDSRTYGFVKIGGYYFNRFVIPGSGGAARPYKSDTAYDNPVRSGASASEIADHNYRYTEEKKFQIISAGNDGLFGGDPGTVGSNPVLFRFRSGISDVGNTTLSKYKMPTDSATKASAQYDNLSNFSDGKLGTFLPN
jgi:prepilin-type N-terminal cleavage/methylation domain-containing protein